MGFEASSTVGLAAAAAAALWRRTAGLPSTGLGSTSTAGRGSIVVLSVYLLKVAAQDASSVPVWAAAGCPGFAGWLKLGWQQLQLCDGRPPLDWFGVNFYSRYGQPGGIFSLFG